MGILVPCVSVFCLVLGPVFACFEGLFCSLKPFFVPRPSEIAGWSIFWMNQSSSEWIWLVSSFFSSFLFLYFFRESFEFWNLTLIDCTKYQVPSTNQWRHHYHHITGNTTLQAPTTTYIQVPWNQSLNVECWMLNVECSHTKARRLPVLVVQKSSSWQSQITSYFHLFWVMITEYWVLSTDYRDPNLRIGGGSGVMLLCFYVVRGLLRWCIFHVHGHDMGMRWAWYGHGHRHGHVNICICLRRFDFDFWRVVLMAI